MSNNRKEYGKGYGTYAADVFLKSWDGQKYTNKIKQTISSKDGFAWRDEIVGLIAEENLIPDRLLYIKTNHRKGERTILANKDLRGHVVRFFLKSSLKKRK